MYLLQKFYQVERVQCVLKNSCTRVALEGGPVSVNPEGNQQAAGIYLGEKRHLFDTLKSASG